MICQLVLSLTTHWDFSFTFAFLGLTGSNSLPHQKQTFQFHAKLRKLHTYHPSSTTVTILQNKTYMMCRVEQSKAKKNSLLGPDTHLKC